MRPSRLPGPAPGSASWARARPSSWSRRREIEAGADAALLADAYEAEHLPVRVAAAAGFVDEVVAPSETRDRIAHVLELAQT